MNPVTPRSVLPPDHVDRFEFDARAQCIADGAAEQRTSHTVAVFEVPFVSKHSSHSFVGLRDEVQALFGRAKSDRLT